MQVLPAEPLSWAKTQFYILLQFLAIFKFSYQENVESNTFKNTIKFKSRKCKIIGYLKSIARKVGKYMATLSLLQKKKYGVDLENHQEGPGNLGGMLKKTVKN